MLQINIEFFKSTVEHTLFGTWAVPPMWEAPLARTNLYPYLPMGLRNKDYKPFRIIIQIGFASALKIQITTGWYNTVCQKSMVAQGFYHL